MPTQLEVRQINPCFLLVVKYIIYLSIYQRFPNTWHVHVGAFLKAVFSGYTEWFIQWISLDGI